MHVLTAVLAVFLLTLGGASDRSRTTSDLALWTVSQATGSCDKGSKRRVGLPADIEPGASASGPGEPVVLPDLARRDHATNRDAEVWPLHQWASDGAASWVLPPATGPPFP